jgi:hypothetical protein
MQRPIKRILAGVAVVIVLIVGAPDDVQHLLA